MELILVIVAYLKKKHILLQGSMVWGWVRENIIDPGEEKLNEWGETAAEEKARLKREAEEATAAAAAELAKAAEEAERLAEEEVGMAAEETVEAATEAVLE